MRQQGEGLGARTQQRSGGTSRSLYLKAILDRWRAHQGFGPTQVRHTLRRERSFKALVTTVRPVIAEFAPFQASEPPL